VLVLVLVLVLLLLHCSRLLLLLQWSHLLVLRLRFVRLHRLLLFLSSFCHLPLRSSRLPLLDLWLFQCWFHKL